METDKEKDTGPGSEPPAKPKSKLEQIRAAKAQESAPACEPSHWLTRRRFLLGAGGVAAGAAAATIITLRLLRGMGVREEIQAEVAGYPRKKIATLSELAADKPQSFHYPFDDLNSLSFVVKLGVPAGGGVGPEKDIVAFSTLCPHMGGDLSGVEKTYLKDHKVIGPCPLHLTTFDLTRHGMVVAGQATESLPQVVLEVTGNDIYATGILGLIYGKRDSADVPEV